MKVKNPSGREYYIQRAKDDRMANWCSRVTPVILEFDSETAEAYADPERSDWIYIRFNGITYCNWAKAEGGFDLLNETSLQISDLGRKFRKRASSESNGEADELRRGPTEDRVLSREDVQAVVEHLPSLREAVASRTAERAGAHEYSDEFRSVVRSIVNEFHIRPFMYAFDYMSWMDEAKRLTDDHDALAVADLETIRKLLVVHWRSDYWDSSNEHWEYIASSGHLPALLERLEELANNMEPATTSGKNKFVRDDEDAEGMDIYIPDETDDENVWPRVEELMAGFDRIRDKITPQQLKMLEVNYYSGGRAVTMRELATATGYGDYKIANIQYGGLAKKLYMAIGYPAPKSTRSENTYWVLGIGEFIDRGEFGLEMQCVMRPEVAEALERLEIVERLESDIGSEEFDDPNAAYAWDIDDLSEILPTDDADIQDFIVYHNPDVMGPLADEPSFEVFTNKSVSAARVGDRVWLITGEGTPRNYSLACWFYVENFGSGEDVGFKHCVSGSEGRTFSPFEPISKQEWFGRFKKDQGNFAFGLSRITTPDVVANLQAIDDRSVFSWLYRSLLEALEAREEGNYDRGGQIVNAASKTNAFLSMWNAYVPIDIEAWPDEANRLLNDPIEIKRLDWPTLHKLVSYINHNDVYDISYWVELAENGKLLPILGRLREVFQRDPKDRTTNS